MPSHVFIINIFGQKLGTKCGYEYEHTEKLIRKYKKNNFTQYCMYDLVIIDFHIISTTTERLWKR